MRVAPEHAPLRRRWTLAVGVGVLAIAVAGFVATLTRGDGLSRREAVAARGASVMPFDLDATTHVFDPTPTGGVQRVIADDPSDREQVALIRSHLRDEVERFRLGDFGDPASIHGHDMPGLSVLEKNAAALDITVRDVDAGAEVTYSADAPEAVAALHDWFAAQLADHGHHAEPG